MHRPACGVQQVARDSLRLTVRVDRAVVRQALGCRQGERLTVQADFVVVLEAVDRR